MSWFGPDKRIYLDHAATTPVDAGVLAAMAEVYRSGYFNPGGLYAEGVSAAKKLSECRKAVAGLIGTTGEHVVFTRGGTESNNMAVLGVFSVIATPQSRSMTREPAPLGKGSIPHVVVSAIEHAAVLECARALERSGTISLSVVPVDGQGVVDMKELKKMLRPETVLVSIMYVNNEIGTVQPVREIAKLVRWFRKQNGLRSYPLVHTDAIQAANYLDINVERLGVDLMSFSGSKIYGPKSSGVLYVRNKELTSSMFHGGDQESGLRAGTEDLAQVAGFAKALELVRKDSEAESARLSALRDFMIAELIEKIPGVIVNGSLTDRIANNVNISVPGISGERLVIELDARGISVASKSACKEDSGEASHVLTAIHNGASTTDGAVRFTLGRTTKKAHIERAVLELAKTVKNIRVFEDYLTNML